MAPADRQRERLDREARCPEQQNLTIRVGQRTGSVQQIARRIGREAPFKIERVRQRKQRSAFRRLGSGEIGTWQRMTWTTCLIDRAHSVQSIEGAEQLRWINRWELPHQRGECRDARNDSGRDRAVDKGTKRSNFIGSASSAHGRPPRSGTSQIRPRRSASSKRRSISAFQAAIASSCTTRLRSRSLILRKPLFDRGENFESAAGPPKRKLAIDRLQAGRSGRRHPARHRLRTAKSASHSHRHRARTPARAAEPRIAGHSRAGAARVLNAKERASKPLMQQTRP